MISSVISRRSLIKAAAIGSISLGLNGVAASLGNKLLAGSGSDASVDPAFNGPDLDINDPAMCTQEGSLYVCKDLVYSLVDGNTLELDIYLPLSAAQQKVPGIVYFHGGGWHSGGKSEAQPTPPGDTSVSATPFSPALVSSTLEAIPSTFAIISVNYRLTVATPSEGILNPAGFPQSLQDAKTAIQWVRAKTSAYIDSSNLVAWGFSSGGYLATMIGTSEGVPEFAGRGPSNIPSSVNAVVAVSPAVDLSVLKLAAYEAYLATVNSVVCAVPLAQAQIQLANTADFSPPVGTALFLGLTALPLTADSATDSDSNSKLFDYASPINYLDQNTVPMLIFNGSCDTIVPTTGMDNFMLVAGGGNVQELSDSIHIAGPPNKPQLITRVMSLGQSHGSALYYKDTTDQGTLDSSTLVSRFLDALDRSA